MAREDTSQQELTAALNRAAQIGAVIQRQMSSETRSRTPQHPIKSMQGPFEESIVEASRPSDTRAQDAFNKLSPKARRQRILDANSKNGTYNEQWRSDPLGPKFHPLTKIMSQIAFGVHLLHQQLAESRAEVMKILQKHVQNIDNFVQRGEEDLGLAIVDVKERISYLKLPLEHVDAFDSMLDDKPFRKQMSEGHEKMEKVVSRSASFARDLHVDIQKGLESTARMGKYLDDIEEEGWPTSERGGSEIFIAMQANVQGWVQCMSKLQMKANALSVGVVHLGSLLNVTAERVRAASRRGQSRTVKAAQKDELTETSISHSGDSPKQQLSPQRQADASGQQQQATFSARRSSLGWQSKPLPLSPDLLSHAVIKTSPGSNTSSALKQRGDDRQDESRIGSCTPKSKKISSEQAKGGNGEESAKSTKSKRDTKKPPPLLIDTTSVVSNADTPKTDSSRMAKFTEFAHVFRFHGPASKAPSPLNSPAFPPPPKLFGGSTSTSPNWSPMSSPKLQPARFKPPEVCIQVEPDSPTVYELDKNAQATLNQARSRLRQLSPELLSSNRLQSPRFIPLSPNASLTSHPPSPQQEPLAHPLYSPKPSFVDSAYASSPEPELQKLRVNQNERPPRNYDERPRESQDDRPKTSHNERLQPSQYERPRIGHEDRPRTSPSRPSPNHEGFGILTSPLFKSPSMTSFTRSPTIIAASDREPMHDATTALPAFDAKQKPLPSPLRGSAASDLARPKRGKAAAAERNAYSVDSNRTAASKRSNGFWGIMKLLGGAKREEPQVGRK